MLEELEISLFLAGHEVVDEHGDTGGDGFVDGCATGLADDEVVFFEELGDFFCPSEKPDATGIFGTNLAGA